MKEKEEEKMKTTVSSSSTSELQPAITSVFTTSLPLGSAPILYDLLFKEPLQYIPTAASDSTSDEARITIAQVSYNTKITKNKVELRDATSDELVCTVQIENGQAKLIYNPHDIYTVDEDGFLSHNICGRFSGFLELDSINKREIIHVCENLLKQQAGEAIGSLDSTTLSSSSSSTLEYYTTKAAVSSTSSSGSDTVTTSSSNATTLLLEVISPELSDESAISVTGESATNSVL